MMADTGAAAGIGRATLEDVARAAGVSVATVDRVVNRRDGVRDKTIARVEAAVSRLGYRPDPAAARLARNQSFRFLFILPSGANSFMTLLAEQVARTADWLASQRAVIDVQHVDVFDPDALARALETVLPGYAGVATIALDHPRVRAAIDDLAERDIPVVTLVSDVPSARRLHYVGIDNPAAGRTAATLMGRFLHGRSGAVGVIAGSLALRDHAERQFGFNQVLTVEYPQLTVFPAVEGRDDNELTYRATVSLLREKPDLIGIYNVGAGNRGIAAALNEAGRSNAIVWIAHELTAHTRRFLVRGEVDAIISQNPGHEARSAARVLLAYCSGDPLFPDQERIGIDIFLRDNLP
ncbi:LacI family DNA-binding transcriptional regulator [Bosea sp. Tri-49]|uniref:LacI family DNA-binding transcriptional regulator n=1 Tax=Bosea sp. Tri-49 TaxID=1867715 RepID=UPI003FA49391